MTVPKIYGLGALFGLWSLGQPCPWVRVSYQSGLHLLVMTNR